jgi:tartrate dehydratase beta subunit/fumarate hydratase class I family protein
MPDTSEEMTNILQQMFNNQTDIAAAVELVTYEVGNTLNPLRDSSIMSELFLKEISKLMGIMVKGIDTLAKNKGGAPGGGNSSQSIIPSASDIVKSITFGVFPKVVKAYAKGMRNLITELSDINDVSLEKLKTFSEASKAISEFAKIRVSGVIKAGVASRLLGGSIKSFVETLSKLSDASVKKLSALAEAFSDFNKVQAGPMLKFGLALIFIRKPLTGFIDAINNTTVGNFVESADKIAKGITKLGKADVSSLTKLGNTILKVGGGFILFAGGLFVLGKSLKTFSEVKWEDLGKAGLVIGGIVAATYGLSKIQGSLLKSALGIAAMGAALAVTAIALRTFESVKWEDLGKATVALGGLALLGTFLGKSMATIAKGALADRKSVV